MSAMPDLEFTSVIEQAALVADGIISARQLTEFTLERIHRLDPVLNAFKVVLDEEALAEADARDAAQASGAQLGRLHGVPIAIKDENDVAGTATTFGTAAVTRIAAEDSELVRRLRAEGAIIIGKTLMPEFGIWPYTESETNGHTRNPWNRERSTAGSSGGTAAAVASGMVAAGIGGDGGGSIRLPASFCGLYGLKPQRGRVSASPNRALWRALGTTGPLTRSVADSALLYDVIAGTLPIDAYSAEAWSADGQPTTLTDALTAPFSPLRILVVAQNPGGGPAADADELAALQGMADALRELGHTVTEGTLPAVNLSLPFMLQLLGGIADEAGAVDHPERLEKRTKRMLAIGRPFAGLGGWAERTGSTKAEQINRVFDSVDLVLMPTTPTPAVPIGQLDGVGFISASLKATPAASFTSIWNVCGNPAAAIPAGFTASGLPVSVQLVAAPHQEPVLVSVSAQLESIRPWADRRPVLNSDILL